MGLCISMIAYIRLPSLKVSTLLLIGLLVYDVFWVSEFHLIYTQSLKIILIQNTIAYFRVLVCLCVKTNLCAKLFTLK